MNAWPIRQIQDVVEFLNARRVPVKSSDRAKRKGVYPYYGASGIVDYIDDFIFDGTYLLVSEDGENLRSRNTPIAFMASGRFWVNNHAHILDEKEPGVLKYLSYALNQTDLSPYVTGAAQPKLNKANLAHISLAIPEADARLAINAILGALDDKIEVNRKAAATLEAMARALYRSWFVDFDPVHAKAEGRQPAHMDAATAALFPDRVGDNGLPLGWNATTIGEVADIVGGSTPSTKQPEFWDGGVHLWATPKDLSNLNDPVLLDTERRVTDAGLAKISSGLLPAGSLLLSSRAPIGYLAIAARPVAINQGFIGIRETAQVSSLEAYHWCVENMDLIHANANGSTFQEIAKKNFRPMDYIMATDDVRRAFNDKAGAFFRRIELLCEENCTLANLRDTLLPRLMSGELRVGAAEKIVSEAV